jgi:hypothetical protein
MNTTKDVTGRQVQIFDKIAYPAQDRRGKMTMRVAEVTGIYAVNLWRKSERDIRIRVKYESTDVYGKRFITASLRKAHFLILPNEVTEF